MTFAPCIDCLRHIRVTEAVCPFCAAAVPAGFAARAVPGTTRRLSRGAAFAFASTLAVAGCSDATPGGDAATGDAPSSDVVYADQAVYGAPPDVVQPDVSMPDAGYTDHAVYGAPPDVLVED